MTAAARFDLKMAPDEKTLVARAAALMGTTMAGFVRAAAKEKALEMLERESRIELSQRDFAAFSAAVVGSLDNAFAPNPALAKALTKARRTVRRS